MATATGYSGLWGTSLTLLVNRNPMRRAITRLMRRLPKDQELMLTLNGAAAGSTASADKARVQHSTDDFGLGGVRTIEVVDPLNRATVAGDKTAIDDDLSVAMVPSTYPDDAAGDFPA